MRTARNSQGHQQGFAASLVLSAFSGACIAQDTVDVPALDFEAAYTGDLRRNTHGGLAVGTAYSEVLDLGLTWRTQALGTHVTTNLAVMYTGGDEISAELVGDLQGVNSLEAAAHWRLYESWVEFGFGTTSGSLRAGVLDLNAEFDTPVTQDLFTASPFWIGTDLSQTGVRGPVVWPITGLGIRAAGNLHENLEWRLGAYDGAPGSDDDAFTSFDLSSGEGALLIGEIAYSSASIRKIAVGTWAYTAKFERIDSALTQASPDSGNHGVYGLVDLSLGRLGDTGFDAAVRAGLAADEFNAVEHYVGMAVVAHHFWSTRPEDRLGIGIAWAHLGSPYREASDVDGYPTTSAETLFELTYRAEVLPWLALVPNVQFVSHPGGVQGVDDSWIAALRFEFSHTATKNFTP